MDLTELGEHALDAAGGLRRFGHVDGEIGVEADQDRGQPDEAVQDGHQLGHLRHLHATRQDQHPRCCPDEHTGSDRKQVELPADLADQQVASTARAMPTMPYQIACAGRFPGWKGRPAPG